MKRLASNHAFSLMEMILVISLLGIVTATAIPALINTQSMGLSSAAKKVESDLRFAQNLAITTGTSYGLRTINNAEITQYEVYKVSDNTLAVSPYDHAPLSEDLSVDFDNVTFSANADVRFDSQGDPTFVTGSSPIGMQNENDETKTITINSVGYIAVE